MLERVYPEELHPIGSTHAGAEKQHDEEKGTAERSFNELTATPTLHATALLGVDSEEVDKLASHPLHFLSSCLLPVLKAHKNTAVFHFKSILKVPSII